MRYKGSAIAIGKILKAKPYKKNNDSINILIIIY